jgi:hypothetical protein
MAFVKVIPKKIVTVKRFFTGPGGTGAAFRAEPVHENAPAALLRAVKAGLESRTARKILQNRLAINSRFLYDAFRIPPGDGRRRL